jgi:endo-1,4-beta-D-glucanase Y
MRTLFFCMIIGVGLLAGSPSSLRAAEPPGAAHVPPWLQKAWHLYVSSFTTPEGRVIDNGNGGISHSEGQGYAMLIAVRAQDRQSFERIWAWTKANLWIRGDDLFAWAWDPASQPHVSDIDDASDGNILIAWALLEAASLWGVEDYRTDAHKIIDAVARLDVVPTRFGPTLLPGSRGFGTEDRRDGPVVNLSYWVFPALERFAQDDKNADWRAVINAGLELVQSARFGPQSLPSDWISLAQDSLRPARGFTPVFGYDVVRVPLYLAWGHPADRERIGIFEKALTEPPFVPPAVIDVGTGKPGERLGGKGYSAIATTIECVLHDAPADRSFLDVKKELYYPTTLHILSLLAINDIRPSCLQKAAR